MMSHAAHFKKAIEQAQHKPPVPHIDFTIHQLEDGNTVSTQERVIKEVSEYPLYNNLLMALPGTSSSDANPNRCPVLLHDRPFKARYCLLEESLLPRRQAQ